MKVVRLLEGMARPAEGRFAQRFADQLQTERDTVW
jgi:hypothetical protein